MSGFSALTVLLGSSAPVAPELEAVLRPLAAPSAATRAAFLVIIGLVALERIYEMWLSRRNAGRVLARGGVEVGAGHYPVMVLLHTMFLAAAGAEVWFLSTPAVPWLTLTSLAALALTMALRYWAILSLGDRWNTRVVYEPGRPPVRRGPYRWLRHPNYLAVILEILFLPLIHGAWRTALVFSIANAILLRHRIRVENLVVHGQQQAAPVRGTGR